MPELVYAQAATMARNGRYEEAKLLLSQLSAEDRMKSGVVDLLARISAQQGQLDEAEELWNQVLRQVPTSESCQNAILRIAELRRKPKWLNPLLKLVAVAALVLLGVLLAWDHKAQGHTSVRPETGQEYGVVSHAVGIPLSHEPEKLPEIRLPGISVQSRNAEVIATFESGLFQHGAKLSPEARTTLAGLARELGRHAGSISVIVEGCSDNLPLRKSSRYRNNSALRIARANAVFQYLTESAGLGDGMFSLRSIPAGPYPNDSADERAKNRSVVIRILGTPS